MFTKTDILKNYGKSLDRIFKRVNLPIIPQQTKTLIEDAFVSKVQNIAQGYYRWKYYKGLKKIDMRKQWKEEGKIIK